MNILIIGGNSYIGKSFVKLASNEFVCATITHSQFSNGFFDLTEASFQGIDAIINCAAIVHNHFPEKTVSQKINADLPYHLASIAKRAGVRHFIQLSTIAVYGNTPFIQSNSSEIPDSLYASTKLEGDQKILPLMDENFTVTIVRPPMVYGTDAPGNMNRLISLIRYSPLLPFRHTTNRRSMIYIEHLTNALEKILKTQTRGIVLVSNEETPSLYELTQAIASSLHVTPILFTPPRWMIRWFETSNILGLAKLYGSSIVDDSKTRLALGEYAPYSLVETIQRTLIKTQK